MTLKNVDTSTLPSSLPISAEQMTALLLLQTRRNAIEATLQEALQAAMKAHENLLVQLGTDNDAVWNGIMEEKGIQGGKLQDWTADETTNCIFMLHDYENAHAALAMQQLGATLEEVNGSEAAKAPGETHPEYVAPAEQVSGEI